MLTFIKVLKNVGIYTLLLFLVGCERAVDATGEFSFPVGDAAKGKQVFITSSCISCHSLEGIDDSGIKKEITTPVKLGGAINYTISYAELLTSIINPSHKLAEGYDPTKIQANDKSLMRNYNDIMTVNELIDLVTFLEGHYQVKPYKRAEYRHYNL